MSVQRIYVKKKKAYAVEAAGLLRNLKESLRLEGLRDAEILNRYDIEGIGPEELSLVVNTVFAEPMADEIYYENYPVGREDAFFAVEYLPGQYDQRSDSAEQCVKVMTGADEVKVRCAKAYLFKGSLTSDDVAEIKKLLINAVDQREADPRKPETLVPSYERPAAVKTVDGFLSFSDGELKDLLKNMGLAMSLEDIKTAAAGFAAEKRDPTETELRILDTYWSDHCRHTTFNTELTSVDTEEGPYSELFRSALGEYRLMRREVYGDAASGKPETLMNMAVVGAKYALKKGLLDNLEISDENNACSVEIDVKTDGGTERWLLQFKNETHNHPTEIEPYGGAATCLGGAIRDPLSGRAFVYHAMRVSGAADPRAPLSATIPGKLPQRKIVREAAEGFSSYGNQIGVATGYVKEFYHPGFAAKRLEAGAVIGAVPKKYVRRETPSDGDAVILVGGRTGRDGIGGATGSSKEHSGCSVELCGAEVQKGNAPEEHKLQRLFRRPEVSLMIKKCNDFGAGGVAVAVGELAPGIEVDLDAVPKKYAGLNGTEVAISESQERMAAVVSPENVRAFLEACSEENLEATVIAGINSSNRFKMTFGSAVIADIPRSLLDSAGAPRRARATISSPSADGFFDKRPNFNSLKEAYENILSDLNGCSQIGLVEMFDSTIGAGSVLTPFGGSLGETPAQAMAAKIPVSEGDTDTISVAACGYNPFLSSWSPFHGGMYAVVESVSKAAAAGARLADMRLSFQEYFEKLGDDPVKWGKPAAALLGALTAQKELGLAAIGGKDSMSGSFRDEGSGLELHVPPTLISFAVAPSEAGRTPVAEFMGGGEKIYWLKTNVDSSGLPDFEAFRENLAALSDIVGGGAAGSVYAVESGGVLEALAKMSFGNRVGFRMENSFSLAELSFPFYGSFVFTCRRGELPKGVKNAVFLGVTSDEPEAVLGDESIPLEKLIEIWKKPLEKIYPTVTDDGGIITPRDFGKRSALVKSSALGKPGVAMLSLAGTNCEYDMKRAFERAGSRQIDPFIFRNLTVEDAERSCREFADAVRNSQILAIPGGFSAGDEPEGSGKFYVAVLKNPFIAEAIDDLLNRRDGLVIGVCNGFQALLKSGLLTYGRVTDMKEEDPTLTFNSIGRHVARTVRVRVSSLNSPWMSLRNIGEVDAVPVSHGEGRFVASVAAADELFASGRVLFQYADANGDITMEFPHNPNGSSYAVEAVCSPDGRILGKMGHSERLGRGLLINGNYADCDQRIFEAGVKYFI